MREAGRVTSRGATSPSQMRRMTTGVLGVPLVVKLIGANVIVVAAAIAVQMVLGRSYEAGMMTVLTVLGAASLVNLILVRLALDPIRHLEKLATRVSGGEFDIRANSSPFADAGLTRLGSTINSLLDSLAAERARIQALGAEVVYAQDAERARVSRELHDSIAQNLVAVRFQLSAASNEATGDLRNRLITIGSLVGSAMEEVKNVSYSLHPRVAEDLGLNAALTALATQTYDRSGVTVHVNTPVQGRQISAEVSATLFRVAQEALRNIERHAFAKSANVDVESRDGSVRMEVSDDGSGFDQVSSRIPAGNSRLARVRDRVLLAGGSMSVSRAPNGGTRVIAELKTLKAS
jgi:signal transduction histidine kinase